MVFCTCLCLKKNAIHSLCYSSATCRHLTSSSSISLRPVLSPHYARLYSNSSAPLLLLRQNTNHNSSTLNASSQLRHELPQYPLSTLDRASQQWRFMSVKRSTKTPPTTSTTQVHGFKYETNDVTLIERLASPTPNIQHHIQQSINSAPATLPQTITTTNSSMHPPPPLDTRALKSLVQNGHLRDALSLVLHPESTHKGILDCSPKDRRLFFTRLGYLSPCELDALLDPWMEQHVGDSMHNKRLKQLLKCLGTNLPINLVEHLVRRYPLDLSLQTALFQRFVKSYTACQSMDDQGLVQLDTLLEYLDPTSNSNMEKTPDSIRTRLYNLALNGCLKMGYADHVEKVLAHMKSSGCSLDVATYNMLIRSWLDNGDTETAFALYEQLTSSFSISPTPSPSATTATFNTFIKYACRQQLWDDMTLWLNRLLKHPDQQPNSVTLRILTVALTDHIDQPAVIDAFERVATMVPVTNFELETTVNTSIVHLLRHKHTNVALEILYKLFDRLASTETYHLSVNSYNILIHALAQKGDIDAADQILVAMRDQRLPQRDNDATLPTITTILPPPDIVSYTTLIHGYIRSADANSMDIGRISALYKELMDRGLETNAILQAVILYAMVKSGFQDIKGCAKLFESMVGGDGTGVPSTILRNNHDPQWHLDIVSDSNLGTRQRTMDPKMSLMTMYNMMMDGYFLHQHYRQRRQQHDSSPSSSSSTTNINKPNRRNQHIPPESLALLNRAIEKGLPLTTATLNIWVRGLAVFNHDLPAAESMVKWMSLAHGVEMNERTIYYLVQTAMRQDRRDKVRKWITLYEGMGNTIQGYGLLYFKNMVIKS